MNPSRNPGAPPPAAAVSRVAALEAQIAVERAEDARRHREVEARIQELRETMQTMRERLDRGAQDRERLKAQLAERAVEIDALRRDLDAARDAAATAPHATAAADLTSARDRIVRLTDRLRELESQSPEIAGRDPADHKLIERLDSEVRRRDQALIVAAEKTAAQEKRIAALEKKLEHARARIAEVRDALLAEKRVTADGRGAQRPRGVDEILALPDDVEEPPPPERPTKPDRPARAEKADPAPEPASDASWVDVDGTVRGKGDDSSSWVDVDASQSASASLDSQSGTAGSWVAVEPEPKKPPPPPEPPTPHESADDERMTGVRVPPRRPAGLVTEESISVEDERRAPARVQQRRMAVAVPQESVSVEDDRAAAPRAPARRAEPEAPPAAPPPPAPPEDRMAGVRVPPRRPVAATQTSILVDDEKPSRIRAKSRPKIVAPRTEGSDVAAPPPGAPPCIAGLRAEGVVMETELGLRWPAREAESRRPVDVLLFARPLTPNETRRLDAMLVARHPSIACALSTASIAEGQYVVFERSAGESLEEWVRRVGPLPERTALPVALQVARALRQAAFHGALHGDLSPYVVRVEPTGHLQVENVGLGALHPGPDRPVPAPQFASPERLRGSPPPDARSDVYSLGALLYFLLTGVAPHEGDRDHVVRRLAVGSTPDPREKNPNLSPDTAKLVMKMMAADPDRRQATWDQALLDLERRIPGPRSEDLRGNLRARAVATFAEHPWLIVSGAVAPILVVAAGLFFGGEHGPTPRERFETAVKEADALIAQGDVEGARIVLGRFVEGIGDPAVEREAAARLDFLKGK